MNKYQKNKNNRAVSKINVVSVLIVFGLVVLTGVSCSLRDRRYAPVRPVREADAQVYRVEVTGYCACGVCCGWKRNWRGVPVVAAGPQKGQRKQIGVTASGVKAQRGTIAADTSLFPFDTIMYVPGYGYGVVEDRGGAIKGRKIDLYFDTHTQALEWGRQHKNVKVWLP